MKRPKQRRWKRVFVGVALVAMVTLPSRMGRTSDMVLLKGFAATEELIRERLIADPAQSPDAAKFSLSDYLGKDLDPSLLELMGVYKSQGLSQGYLNSEPNGINMLLWYLVIDGISKDAAKLCTDSKALPASEDFVESLKPLCSWPSADAQKEEVLEEFWLSVMQYDAPVTEYEAWKSYFLGEDYKDAKPDVVISSMITSIFMNPYFLLRI